MRLAGEKQLDRLARIGQDGFESFLVPEDERGALVRREAAGEADGEHLGVQHLVGGVQVGLGEAALLQLGLEPLPGEVGEEFGGGLVEAAIDDFEIGLLTRGDTSAAAKHPGESTGVALRPNAPNPFGPSTVIQFELPAGADHEVLTALGRRQTAPPARRLAGTTAGVAAGVLVAICEPLVFYDSAILATPLAVFLAAATLHATLLAAERPNLRRCAVVGIVNMNLILVDVTHVPRVARGDEVIAGPFRRDTEPRLAHEGGRKIEAQRLGVETVFPVLLEGSILDMQEKRSLPCLK